MSTRRLIIAAHDILMTAGAIYLSFFLRWGAEQFWARLDRITIASAVVTFAATISLWLLRLNRSPWKFASIADLVRIGGAAAVAAVSLVVLDFVSGGALTIPRTVPAIFWFVQVLFLAGPRMLYRAYRTWRRERRATEGVYRIPVLIAGAGYEAEQLIRRLRNDDVARMQPLGLLTHRQRRLGERIQNVPVLGLFSDLEEVFRRLATQGTSPRRLIVTREALKVTPAIDDLIGAAQRLGLSCMQPSESLSDVEKTQQALQLTPVSIDDLLGRSRRDIDLTPLRNFIAGRRVLVTGAGGSIGSELCRQIAAMAPATLMPLDQSEFALYTVANELRHLHPAVPLELRLASVTHRESVFRTFHAFRPDLVFHAAALKHVDLVEAHAITAADTNAIGTRHVADAALEANAACAVFISTDKAVNPVSVLGATKRAGEIYWAAAERKSREAGRPTRFLTVRFGNVLGSSGSVIPLFTEQLKRGGPVTVTHPEVERYFMTIGEAVTLVLMASAVGAAPAELSSTYVLDMGEPVRIVDLARRMIRLQGLEPDRDVQIVFTGLRPGERLSEELEYSGERLRETSIPGVRASEPRDVEPGDVERRYATLQAGIAAGDRDAVLGALSALVPEYRPASAPEPAERGNAASLRDLETDAHVA